MLAATCIIPSSALASLSLPAKKNFTPVLLIAYMVSGCKSLLGFTLLQLASLVLYLFEDPTFDFDRTREINGVCLDIKMT